VTIDGDWNEEDFLNAAEKFQLIYLFSKEPLEFTDPHIQLVDTKLTFKNKLGSLPAVPDITTYNAGLSQELEELAFLSGVYSRFKIDKRLENDEFEKLYKLWIKKAWESHSILEASPLQGMVSYAVEGKSAAIGLIAVAEKRQGKGLGRQLMKAAEVKAFSLGAKTISVSTQQSNTPACRLYESLDYTLIDTVFVYHYWKT
tara:strand:- start:229 stop:831 length:603 start_codon:yes stop_codon:yes gene_type:complete